MYVCSTQASISLLLFSFFMWLLPPLNAKYLMNGPIRMSHSSKLAIALAALTFFWKYAYCTYFYYSDFLNNLCELLQIDDACSAYLSTDSQPQVSQTEVTLLFWYLFCLLYAVESEVWYLGFCLLCTRCPVQWKNFVFWSWDFSRNHR